MKHIPHKKVEIFCGTGGVGKTTLATSRAIHLSRLGKKVLLITIDPAKRLKQVLNIDDAKIGEVQNIKCDQLEVDGLDALLMSPQATLKRIAKDSGTPQDFENVIIKTLTRPYGGMNEIMATIEVQYFLDQGTYDCIVLDTPPGKHFIDFLNASEKIQRFFDKGFIEVFKQIKKSFDKKSGGKVKLLGMILSSGIKKVLSYLEKVTGKEFVSTFVNAVSTIYGAKEHFLSALDFQKQLQKKDFSNWFLVTAVDQQKILQAEKIQKNAVKFMHNDNFLLINKCIENEIKEWDASSDPELQLFKDSLLKRELALKEFAGENFPILVEFPEILSSSPAIHVKTICENWHQFEGQN